MVYIRLFHKYGQTIERCVWSFLMIDLKTGHKGFQVREIPAQNYVEALARHFEETRQIAAPEWAGLVKTGCFNEMPPAATNWWYLRAAAIARQVYLHPGTSVTALRHRFGAGQRNGTCPNHHRESGKKIIRTVLAQLEKLGWVKVVEGEGRVLTPKGQKQLDSIAAEVGKK